MPIVFPCSCGQPMRTGDEHAGKQVRCPKCSAVVVVPARSVTIQTVRVANKADEAFEVLESVDDLPTVERVPKRRKKQNDAPEGPRLRSIEEELYCPPPTFLGMDGGGWLRLFFVAITFVLCFACCAISVVSRDIYILIPMAVTDLMVVGLVWLVLRVGR